MKKELFEYEKKVFSQLKKEAQPSPQLEEKILQQLKYNQLIRSPKKIDKNRRKQIIGLAASVLIFSLGSFFGHKMSALNTIDPSSGYMVLLYEGNSFKSGEPEERALEYGNWMRELSMKGVKIQGQELMKYSLLVDLQGLSNSTEVRDEYISGYFLVEAGNLEELEEIVRHIPHLKYGGKVEVKKITTR